MRDFKIGFIEIEKIGNEHDIAFQNLPKLALQSFDEKLLTQQQIEILLFGWYEEDRNNTQYMKVNYGWNGDIHSEAQMSVFFDLDERGLIKELNYKDGMTCVCYKLTDKGRTVATKIVEYGSRPKYQQRFIRFQTYMDLHALGPSIFAAIVGGVGFRLIELLVSLLILR